MKKIITEIVVIFALIATLAFAYNKIQSLKADNNRLRGNQSILLTEKHSIMAESQRYKVSDSLNAVQVSELELTLREYKRYRSEDAKLIKSLKAGKSDLQKVVASQTETITTLSAKLQDSVRIDTATSRKDTLKLFSYKSKWTDVSGYIDLGCDSVSLQINNRESLKVVETITYKRFLGFLWKTNKAKSRQVDIVSENPNTKIVDCEYISIKR